MADTQLNIWLKLRDQASRALQGFKRNWLAITASITAALYAIRKAFDYIELGAKAKQIEEAFNRVSVAVGENAEVLKKALKEASAETVNFSNVAGNVSALLGQGLNLEQIAGLMKVARAEARKMGTDVEQAFTQIANAVAGGFLVTVKRAYGLNVELASAFESYAKTLGKTVDEVRKYHKAQALANEIIQKAKTDLEAFNLEQKTELEYIQQLRARWLEFKEDVGKGMLAIIRVLDSVLQILRSTFAKLVENFFAGLKGILFILVKIGEGFEKILTKIPKVGEKFRGLTNDVKESYKSLEKNRKMWADIAEEWIPEAVKALEPFFVKTQDGFKSIAITGNKVMSNLKEDVKKSFNAMEEFGKQAARNIQDAFSNFFFKAFTGELRNLKDVFADFGRAILQSISNILAQAFVTKMFESLGLGALLGFQTGTPYIPKTGLYMLHKGEAVIPAHEVKEAGGGVVININQVIQAWDAEDVYRNRKTLSAAIAQEIQTNSKIRGVIKQYV